MPCLKCCDRKEDSVKRCLKYYDGKEDNVKRCLNSDRMEDSVKRCLKCCDRKEDSVKRCLKYYDGKEDRGGGTSSLQYLERPMSRINFHGPIDVRAIEVRVYVVNERTYVQVVRSMEEFKVREARLEDKEAVLGIRDNVYEGNDYLPIYYEHFISAKEITPFVLLHKDKIIGFTAANIVDDGQTVVTRAVRLHPEYVGKGLYGYLDECIAKWAKDKQVFIKAFTSSDHNSNIAKASFRQANSLILSKNILIYVVDPDTLRMDTKKELQDTAITIVSESLLTEYLTSTDVKKYLFPEDRIIVDYVPFKLLSSNISLMRGPGDVTTIFSDVRILNNQHAGLLSFGTFYPVSGQNKFLCIIEMYGTDESSLKKHAAGHLKRIAQKADDITSIVMSVDRKISTEIVDEVFKEFAVTRRIWRDPNTSEVCYKDSFLWEKKL